MSNGFDERLRRGEDFEKELLEFLQSQSSIEKIVQNGTEHTHADFVALLRRNDSPAAKFVRFAPDGVLMRKDASVIHYDAKASETLERDAYETYMKYYASGCAVLLFVKYGISVYQQFVQLIRFLDSTEYVNRYPPHKRFPVIDGWICPRAKPEFKAGGQMSGTPYKYIDFDSMIRIAWGRG